MKLKFIEKIQRTSDCFSFIFKPEVDIKWQAGQYMHFSIPHNQPDDRGINRFFTISSAPFEKNIMITTRFEFEKSSTFKKALFSLEKNQIISAVGPDGEFVISEFNKSYVLIAGGIGITPYRSILLDLEFNNNLKDLEVFLLYSNRNNEIVFKDDFDRLANSYNTFKVRYIISPERLNLDLIKIAVPYYNQRIFYISGPPPLVKAVEDELVNDAISLDNIKLDYFPGY